jgi:hypothetical protein
VTPSIRRGSRRWSASEGDSVIAAQSKFTIGCCAVQLVYRSSNPQIFRGDLLLKVNDEPIQGMQCSAA